MGLVGCSKFSYFYAPYGFAMLTGVEQIKADGSPLDAPRRWLAEPAIDFSLANYMHLLLSAPVGRYRAIIFVVTTEEYSPSDIRLTREEIRTVSKGGGLHLPAIYSNFSTALQSRCLDL
jgi:hypothetical protein